MEILLRICLVPFLGFTASIKTTIFCDCCQNSVRSVKNLAQTGDSNENTQSHGYQVEDYTEQTKRQAPD